MILMMKASYRYSRNIFENQELTGSFRIITWAGEHNAGGTKLLNIHEAVDIL